MDEYLAQGQDTLTLVAVIELRIFRSLRVAFIVLLTCHDIEEFINPFETEQTKINLRIRAV